MSPVHTTAATPMAKPVCATTPEYSIVVATSARRGPRGRGAGLGSRVPWSHRRATPGVTDDGAERHGLTRTADRTLSEVTDC